MILLADTITPRLRYISEFIATETGVGEILTTTDLFEYGQYEGVRLNYTSSRTDFDEYWIEPHSLLFEKTIKQVDIECFEVSGTIGFFRSNGDFPFDVFAASFYLISRFEEYLPYKKDEYGRYACENSIAFRNGFLETPIVNYWLRIFKQSIEARFPNYRFMEKGFEFIPTYDIDEAYSYLHKDWWRVAGATAKTLLKGDLTAVAERIKVMFGKTKDPYDSFEYMDGLHKKYGLKPLYFFLVPEKTGAYDRNILPGRKALRELIASHSKKYEVGIHPSWQSGDHPLLLQKEINTIDSITGKKVSISRQHFIRFELPQTFRLLIQSGITKDYSMGYGSRNGFRASVCSPFYWFDLERDERTNLLLYPFCFMDANAFFEQKLSPLQALEEIMYYLEITRKVNGTLITLWHNTFLGKDRVFKGWSDVYEKFLEAVKEN